MTVSNLAPAVSAPVTAGERVAVLDGIRGVAVLGILLINIDALSGYGFTPASAHTILRNETADEITWFLPATLVEAKLPHRSFTACHQNRRFSFVDRIS